MIELPHEKRFARIYKTFHNGTFMFQSFSAKTQEEYDRTVVAIEKMPQFRGWASEVEDAGQFDYYFSQKVEKLNAAEKARPKSDLELLEVAMYDTKAQLEFAEKTVANLRKNHLAAMELLNKLKG